MALSFPIWVFGWVRLSPPPRSNACLNRGDLSESLSDPAVTFPLFPHCAGRVSSHSSAESLRQHIAASIERTWSDILVSPLSEISWPLCSGFYLWWWVVQKRETLWSDAHRDCLAFHRYEGAGARLAGPCRTTLRNMHGATWTQGAVTDSYAYHALICPGKPTRDGLRLF